MFSTNIGVLARAAANIILISRFSAVGILQKRELSIIYWPIRVHFMIHENGFSKSLIISYVMSSFASANVHEVAAFSNLF
jgi:hypothetical protein